MQKIILQGPKLKKERVSEIAAELNGMFEIRQRYFKMTVKKPVSGKQLATLRSTADFDVNVLPEGFSPGKVRLLITDMDSTFINIECVDEIADFMNIKARVAAITASAMRGEINFETSLTRRIGLLEGLSSDALEHVYNERLGLNPGGETMLAGLKARGIKIALVSGGFTYFTDRLKQRYQLDYTLANNLDIGNNKLTGKVQGRIVGAEAKADFLIQLCKQLGINTQQVVAMGDGANDLKMMKLAGLSIAYHAKPAVRTEANTVLNYSGLEGVLGLLDIDKF
ncbi:MAG TPA: phosphoserine phosphatase SerB [Gammaproteobacteria bacterium]